MTRNIAMKRNDPLTQQLVDNASAPKARPFGLSRFLYANFFRRQAVFVGTTLLAAAIGTGVYDWAFESAWAWHNKGKLYNDIIGRYPGLPPNTEPEGGEEDEAAAEDEE